MSRHNIAIVGGGPAGLIAAETLSQAGMAVTVYERKPTLGRKFLMAGRGGLNLTHSEPLEDFLSRYGPHAQILQRMIEKFSPGNLRAWCETLGQETFIGSSGRIFPKTLKASPLLRAWLARLERSGVQFSMSQEWTGWDDSMNLVFKDSSGLVNTVKPDATLLALGGGSWPRLGSDGAWVEILRAKEISVKKLEPANCGFSVSWSDHFRERFSGQPLKTVTLTFAHKMVPGEIMITAQGIEGGAIYALSSSIRETLHSGEAKVLIDLKPGLGRDDIHQRLNNPRKGRSLSTHLQKTIGLPPVAINLLYELNSDLANLTAGQLASLIKCQPLILIAPFPIDRAISTAGGIAWESLTPDLMLKNMPGVFAAGEMLDWEAPTGGYLLQATFSTGITAAEGILKWLADQTTSQETQRE